MNICLKHILNLDFLVRVLIVSIVLSGSSPRRGQWKNSRYSHFEKKCQQKFASQAYCRGQTTFMQCGALSQILTIDSILRPWWGNMMWLLGVQSLIYVLPQSQRWCTHWYFEGILPKGPYLPCVSMAGRALLAGYHRFAMLGGLITAP